ncbi:DUF3768 domain-containing protein [Parasphingorhabdus sp.]|uniref:DUF3768 domain-containing protein n=1 Tax=Parasphingorhabdus sp. TaxID=2709688 RepID=UPI0030017396
MKDEKTAQIRALNDQFRQTGIGGIILHTNGIQALGQEFMAKTVQGVIAFDDFGPNNDPYGEHDFGALTIAENRIFWKIDYYGNDMESGTPDPSDPNLTKRVLTIMLASEY